MPIGIFPESTLVNNRSILPFKRGAFVAGLSVRPIVLKYDWKLISPFTFFPRFVELIILKMCIWHSAHITITSLPIFVPNDYLYSTHADKGKEKWEIYAWAIRDIIANEGNFEKIETSLRHHSNYSRKLCGLKLWEISDS